MIASISYRCTIHSLLLIRPVLLPITWICRIQYFYFIIWIVVFYSFNYLSPVGLFYECCSMSLLCFIHIVIPLF